MSIAQSFRIGVDVSPSRRTVNKSDILIEKTPNEKLQESIKNLERIVNGLHKSTKEGFEKQRAEFKKPVKRRIRKFGRSAKARKRLYKIQKNPPRP